MENQELHVDIKKFRVGKGEFLELLVSKNESDFFSPNDVSGFLASQVEVNPNEIIFEIGSGIGPISIILAKKLPQIQHIYCVEIVPEQINLAIKNIKKYNFESKITPVLGSLFEPIKSKFPGLKANVIIDDCSGLSPVSKELGWYPSGNKIPSGGTDGTKMVIPFLETAGDYLAENGTVYFPTSPNFSDEKKIIDVAKKHFSTLELVLEKHVPLTTQHTEIIFNTHTSNIFEPIIKKGTRGFWTAKIWRAKNPIK